MARSDIVCASNFPNYFLLLRVVFCLCLLFNMDYCVVFSTIVCSICLCTILVYSFHFIFNSYVEYKLFAVNEYTFITQKYRVYDLAALDWCNYHWAEIYIEFFSDFEYVSKNRRYTYFDSANVVPLM